MYSVKIAMICTRLLTLGLNYVDSWKRMNGVKLQTSAYSIFEGKI